MAVFSKLPITNRCYLLWVDSPYVALSKSDEKLSAEKNITGGAPAPALGGQYSFSHAAEGRGHVALLLTKRVGDHVILFG